MTMSIIAMMRTAEEMITAKAMAMVTPVNPPTLQVLMFGIVIALVLLGKGTVECRL
jgi:hypothetical protein